MIPHIWGPLEDSDSERQRQDVVCRGLGEGYGQPGSHGCNLSWEDEQFLEIGVQQCGCF